MQLYLLRLNYFCTTQPIHGIYTDTLLHSVLNHRVNLPIHVQACWDKVREMEQKT